jgi:tetratricopeptide (TPR) repeat protein
MTSISKSLLLALLMLLASAPAFAQKKSKKKDKELAPVEVATVPASSLKSLEREARFIEAMQSRMLGNLQEAVTKFNAILKDDPKNHAAAFQLCRIYYDTDQLDLAEKFAQQAIKTYPYIDWYHIFLAEIRAEKSDYTGAGAAYEALVRTFPQEYNYYYDWAYMLTRGGKLKEAVAAYDELEKVIGIQEELILQKEILYAKMGDLENAAREVQKLIDAEPKEIRYYGILGELYESFEQLDKAEEAYRKILEINPDSPEGKMALADIYRKKGDTEAFRKHMRVLFSDVKIDVDQKIQYFIPIIQSMTEDDSTSADNLFVLELSDIILETHPDDIRALTAKGDVLYSMGRNTAAIELYRQALEKPGPPASIWLQLFSLLAEQEDFETMLEYGDKAMAANPKEGVYDFYKGFAAYQLKKFDVAVEAFEGGLKKNIPTEALRGQMLTSLGDASYEIKDYPKSDSAYDKALEIDPNNAYVLNNYAYYLSVRKERLDKAEKMSKKSNLLVEGNPAFLDTYAWILYQKGSYTDALKWIELAIAALEKPNSAELFDHYGDILFKLGRVDDAIAKWQAALEIEPDKDGLADKIRLKKIVD